ncbi:actin cytoskeleton-regulatory complex protein PAN1-like [Venturia canescens]|uniref:actin cytoskeleton-regulatory complex protein PAN1-like n=1 Tax=Venturia canescens TaxID=32260 RepID=UPI001C9C4B9D|nr:actin cytoskeleton-regulatory complex protein PAN1-like [Venturia canescens]
MSRISLALPLLCAVALGATSAIPYSKISDGAQFGDDFVSQKSSASAPSGSYGHAYSQSADTRSASSSYSSASVSGAVPAYTYGGQDASAAGQFQAQVSSNGDKGALPFWWMGSDSPFLQAGKQSSGGCTSNGCLASTTYQSSGLSASEHQEAKMKSNPFLQGLGAGQQNTASSGASANSLQQESGYGASKKPFLNGASSHNRVSGAASYQDSSFSAGYAQQSQQASGSAGNPFLQQQVPQVSQTGESQFPGYPESEVPVPQLPEQNSFKLTCTGQNQICVPFHLCSYEGYVTGKGLTQVRSGPQECDTNRETCCTIKPADQASAGSSGGGIFGPGNGNGNQPDLSTGEISHAGGAESNGYLPPIGGSSSDRVTSITNLPKEPEQEGASNIPTNIIPFVDSPPPQVGCAAALRCIEELFCTLEGVISTERQTFSSEQLIRRVPLSSCKNPDNGIIGKCCRDPNYVDPWPAGNLPANYSGGFDEQGFPTILNLSKTRPTKKRPNNGGAGNGPRPVISTSYTSPVGVKISSKPSPIGVKTSPKPSPTVFVQNNYPQPTPIAQAPYEGPVKSARPFVPHQVSKPFAPQQPVPQPFVPQQPAPQPFVPQQPAPQPFVPQQPAPQPFVPQQPAPQPFVPQQSVPQPFVPQQPAPQPYVKNNFIPSSTNQNPSIIPTYAPGSQCGRRNVVPRPNGLTDVDVAFGEIPWQAMVLSNTDRKLLCSGAIVAPNAVITAASCVQGLNPATVSVKVGEWKLGYELKHEEPLPFEILNVVSIAPYQAPFQSANSGNEIAMLFLERDMKLDQHVDVLCLPEGQPRPPQPGRKCIATGWGKVILEVHAAGALMHSIDVDVLGQEQCLERISAAENQIPLDDSLFCAKAHRKNNNMCQVDFGGPLACDRGDGFFELAGIYNQDTGCLPLNQVATFSKIPSRWIENTMANPPKYPNNEYLSPVSSGQNPFVHSHGPKVPCECEDHELLPAGSSQYLPPV